jgi:hypothetical protein
MKRPQEIFRERNPYAVIKVDCSDCGTFLVWHTWMMNLETGRRRPGVEIPAYCSRDPNNPRRYYVSEGTRKLLEKGVRAVRARPGRRLVGPDADIPRMIHMAEDLPIAVVCWKCNTEHVFKR